MGSFIIRRRLPACLSCPVPHHLHSLNTLVHPHPHTHTHTHTNKTHTLLEDYSLHARVVTFCVAPYLYLPKPPAGLTITSRLSLPSTKALFFPLDIYIS
ncbi:hypothetical protein LX32DRAFT_110229 [Colletotrichum zoysiae]|uniref:Uncharacterized protein n=1 Tax=Colletotrichum zoysiae TaxID=1216348 RepID=A0AAD9LXB5_9PEZI|nr:hypothetical protein LX32DRAFT_110229 [Colletotrichum zoysiae]